MTRPTIYLGKYAKYTADILGLTTRSGYSAGYCSTFLLLRLLAAGTVEMGSSTLPLGTARGEGMGRVLRARLDGV